MKRRMLALLLALCLVISNLAMGVTARENEEAAEQGGWTVTPVEDADVSLPAPEASAALEELRKAAEVFAPDEIVRAYVVMEEAPLADRFTSKTMVTAAMTDQKLQKQNNVIAAIERNVLGGGKLNVRYQFTYLTNSISIETEFGNLKEIAKLSGVKSVFVMPVYNPVPTNESALPNTAGSAAMTGVDLAWQNLGFTGKGMKIAIIDTGLDLDHPSFAAAPATTADSLTAGDIDAVLRNLNAFVKNSSITADKLYRSVKVPFAFNYVDNNLTADHSRDDQGDHGTHVAGIAAANEVDGVMAKGMAPDAQVIVMKVFGATSGGNDDDIVAALEDAMTLGCDVVNLSLGSPAGFTTTNTEMDLIYQRLANQEIIACISAGNDDHSGDYNMWGTDVSRTANPDNATISAPGIYANALTVASADNAAAMGDYFTVGEEKIFFMDNVEYLYGEVPWSLRDLAGEKLDYVIIPNLGNAADFYAGGSSLAAGKVAVVKRGEITFAEKVANAEQAGAVACIIWNHNDEDDIFSFGMTTADEAAGYMPSIPVALISQNDGNIMAAAARKTMTVSAEMGMRVDPYGGQVSVFSSWGVAPDLSLEPDITGVGGNVYSTLDNGGYGLMSGTSMSSPQLAGISALVMERLYKEYPNAPAGTLRNMAEAMLMSTANPIWGPYAETSPRQQGAGLVDAYQALSTDVYLTVNGGKPKVSMGDSTTGRYTFTFEVHNKGQEAVSYDLYYSLNTEVAAELEVLPNQVEYFMYGVDIPMESEVEFDRSSITVPAGSTARVTATINLCEADKAYFRDYWENGGYVNGFVYLMDVNAEGEILEQLNLPFLGFFGDWTKAPVFDTAYWYHNSAWGYTPANGLPEGEMYYHALWSWLGDFETVVGFNPYTGIVTDENGNLLYDPAHNVVSPNGDGLLDGISDIYLSLLRNAKELTLTWTANGKVMDRQTIMNNPKTMYYSNYGEIEPWVYSWYGWDMGYDLYDFTDENGAVLPSGTQVVLTVDAKVDYGNGGTHSLRFPMKVDTTAPVLKGAESVPGMGSQVLALNVADETALAAVFLADPVTGEAFDGASDYDMDKQADGSYVVYFDVTGVQEALLVLCDYACNETYLMLQSGDPGDPSDPTEPEPTEPKPTEPEPTEPEPEVPELDGVIRLSGANRYETGFAIADQLKETLGVNKFQAVVVAYGQNFPDALTGSYLAAVKKAPILLTEKSVDKKVADYITDNLVGGGTVYILGGGAAVSDSFESTMLTRGFRVVRLAGKNRYETNLAILEEAGVNRNDEVLIATGTNYADSLSASATGLPMLLVGDKLTDAQVAFLVSTSGKFVILGGTGAVSKEIETELESLGDVIRVKGASRYGTSVAIARQYFTNPRAAVLAYAQGFPDGLCGGPLAIALGAPLILTSNESPWDADDYVNGIYTGAVTGGSGRISDDTVRQIFDLAPGTPIVKP